MQIWLRYYFSHLSPWRRSHSLGPSVTQVQDALIRTENNTQALHTKSSDIGFASMAEPQSSDALSSLDPTAPSFSMPNSPTVPIVNGSISATSQPSQSIPNGQEPKQLRNAEKRQSNNPSGERSADVSGSTLSGADLKKQKAAEKAARRAEKIADRDVKPPQQVVQSSVATVQGPSPRPGELQRRPSGSRQDGVLLHRRSGSTSTPRQIPVRPGTATESREKPREEQKRLAWFSHLSNKERRSSIAGVGKEVHPAVLALGIQLRDFVICGGSARCVATLLVFKKVIQAYSTPPGIALSRHLTTHLSHQISYLSHCRPLSTSQGNAIRWLKKLISALDPDMSDSAAKTLLRNSIDQFIRERITLADELIQKEASQRIENGDVILTYAKSSIVEKTLLSSHARGKKFKVIVVDSRPLFEGKNLARSLTAAGIEVQYTLLHGLGDVTKSVTKCILGASAMLGNGWLYSRAGSSMVAMMAKDSGIDIPVIVLCESIKFTSKVALDSIIVNELGDAGALVESEIIEVLTAHSTQDSVSTHPKTGGSGNKKSGSKDNDEVDEKPKKGLEGWKGQSNLHLLNLMYDVTPMHYIDMVITEMGNLPPSAVPVVNGVVGGED